MVSRTTVLAPRVRRPGLRRLLCSIVSVALVAWSLGGCTIRLVSEYDEDIDKAASRLQMEMDTFLTGLETNAGTSAASYGSSREFYPKYAVEVRSVMVRAQAHPKNELSVQQYALMLKSLKDLEDSHRGSRGHEDEGKIPAEAIPAFRDLFNQAWSAIIRLEVAKKR